MGEELPLRRDHFKDSEQELLTRLLLPFLCTCGRARIGRECIVSSEVDHLAAYPLLTTHY